METLIVICAIIVGIFWLMTKAKSPASGSVRIKAPKGTSAKKSKSDHIPVWLSERWEMAEKPDAKDSGIFPTWFFDEVTERQLERLEEEGIRHPPYLTKGMASDLIGLKEPLGFQEEEILRFFKHSTRGVGESQGRHLAAVLLSDPANRAAFESRPPSPFQKEFFKWFGISTPKDMTLDQATTKIREETARLSEAQSEELKYWECFEEFVDELDDPDVREEFEIKKVPVGVIRDAVNVLRSSGKSAEEISGDIDLLVETVLEARPDLERS